MHSSPPARPAHTARRTPTRATRGARATRLARSAATALTAAAALATALAGAAYGAGPATPAPDGPHHSSPVIRTTPEPTRLTVAYDDGAGQRRTYRLRCDEAVQTPGAAQESGTGGDDGTATDGSGTGGACSHLADIGGPVTAVRAGEMCSMIYGGPQTARVTGIWQGRPVRETYRRTNGCEVGRWNRMVPALPNPVADAARHGAAPVRG
jgi:hypothetical protein